LNGKTPQQRQRFKCLKCFKTFVWKRPYNKRYKEQHWFKLWVLESFSIRQLSKISGHSEFKLKNIKNYWLNQEPKEKHNYKHYKHIIFDGTYFHKDGCLLILMNASNQNIIARTYVAREGYKSTQPWFNRLKDQGLNPKFIIMDGEKSVIRAIREVWPHSTIHRCLYNIQREGLRWLRTYPKTQAGKDLRGLLRTLCTINSVKEQDQFMNRYHCWLNKYQDFVKALPKNIVAYKDLKKVVTLLNNALPNMFHYLKEPEIYSTTNALESFYSRLKADYRRHRGLSEKHKISYLNWYCFFKNGLN